MSRHAAPPRRPGFLLVAACLWAALPAAGCGKKGYPLPPLRLVPEALGSLHARQIGDRIVLSLPRPASRTDGSPLGADASVQILMSVREPAPRRASEVESQPTMRWSLEAPRWPDYAQGERVEVSLGLARIANRLGVSEAMTGRRLSFVARVVEPNGRRSEPTEVVSLAICEPPPAPAGAFAWISEQGLRLQWRDAEPGVAADAPPAAYNVYRWTAGGPRPEGALNETPGALATYLDQSAVPGASYRYAVRSVGRTPTCESSESDEIAATLVDAFPPEPPGGLAAVAEGGAIRLFWRPGQDRDLTGYRVYRAIGPGAALQLLTAEALTSTSYTDEDVVPGVDYSYAVTALDGARPPNESPFSDLATERMEAQP